MSPPLGGSGLFEARSEGRKNEQTFHQRGKNDRNDQDRRGCARVATGCLSGLEAKKTNTDGCAKSGETDSECFVEFHNVFGVVVCSDQQPPQI